MCVRAQGGRWGVPVAESALAPPGPIPNPVVTQGSAGEYCGGDPVGGEAAAGTPQRPPGAAHPYSTRRGVEQWQLVGLITQRSEVRILPPLPTPPPPTRTRRRRPAGSSLVNPPCCCRWFGRVAVLRSKRSLCASTGHAPDLRPIRPSATNRAACSLMVGLKRTRSLHNSDQTPRIDRR